MHYRLAPPPPREPELGKNADAKVVGSLSGAKETTI
jgi:hypothetical protein